MPPSADSIQSLFGILVGAFLLSFTLVIGVALIWSSFSKRNQSVGTSQTHQEYQTLVYANSSERVFGQFPHIKISEYQESWESLTAREKEIARHIAAGKNDEEISKELCISHRTAQNHAYNIFRKIGISQRGELKHIVPNLFD